MTAAARQHPEGRDIWQDEASRRASRRGLTEEKWFEDVLSRHVTTPTTKMEVVARPGDLRGNYGSHPRAGKPHGIRPDHGIYSPNGRAVFVEIKRQRAFGNPHEKSPQALRARNHQFRSADCEAAGQGDSLLVDIHGGHRSGPAIRPGDHALVPRSRAPCTFVATPGGACDDGPLRQVHPASACMREGLRCQLDRCTSPGTRLPVRR